MSETDAAPVLVSLENGVATITLNRPERLNALTRELMVLLRDIVEDVARNKAVRVVCLTGAGRGFCAGQDLAERDPRGRDVPFDLEAIQRELYHPVVRAITEMPKPVVASVNGIAAGAGVGLALACDIVIAGRSAKFIQSFAKVGLSADAGTGLALTRLLGSARAKALLMLAETISAEEAMNHGMIFKAVEDELLRKVTTELTRRLAGTPRMALSGIKRAIAVAETSPSLDAYLENEAGIQGDAGRHADYSEGVLSFLEKRKPRFE